MEIKLVSRKEKRRIILGNLRGMNKPSSKNNNKLYYKVYEV